MIRSYGELSFRYMKQQKKRTVLNLLGVLMSAALIAGTGTIMESLKGQMIADAVAQEGNYHVSFNNINREQAFKIKNHRAVEKSSFGKIGGFAILAETEKEEIPYKLLRLNEYDSAAMNMLQLKSRLTSGRLPRKAGEIAIDSRTLKYLGSGYEPGSELIFETGQRRRVSDDTLITEFFYPLSFKNTETDIKEYFDYEELRTFTITGIISEDYFLSENYSSDAIVFRDLSAPGEDELFNSFVLLNNLNDVQAAAEVIAGDIGLNNGEIDYNDRLLNVLGKSIDNSIKFTMEAFTMIILTIIIIATIAVIYNSFNIAMIERIAQLGTMRCVGASPSQIRNLILREAGFICLTAVPPGVIIGVAAMKAVFLMAAALSSNILFEEIQLVISAKVILLSIGICSATVFISALFPALKAGSVPAIDAVRGSGMFSHDRTEEIPFVRKTGLGRNFTFIMALRNIGRNRKRFLVTLFSMIISVVLYVSFGGMLQLLKDSYMIKDEKIPGIKLESEYFIEEDIYSEIKSNESVDLLIKYGMTETSLLASEDKLSSFYRKYVPQLNRFKRVGNEVIIPGNRIICYGNDVFSEIQDLRGRKHSEGIILVRKALFRDENGTKAFGSNSIYSQGDLLTILKGDKTVPLEITSVTDDVYMEDFNEREGSFDIIVDEKKYRELTGKEGFHELYIRLKPNGTKEELMAYLDEITDSRTGYSYTDAQTQADEMIRETKAISIFFYGFIIVIALISTLNIINTISTNLLIRSREFGVIQAVGLDQRGLKKMVFLESVIYNFCSLLIGSLIGTGIWYLLVRNMGNIRITLFQIPWREIVISAIALAIITLLSGYFPLKRIRRKPIIENIRMEE